MSGYEEASKKALKILEELECYKVEDPRSEAEVSKALKATISSKIPNFGDFFSSLVARACIRSLPDLISRFDTDNIRVAHILGGSVTDSVLMSGMVIKRGA